MADGDRPQYQYGTGTIGGQQFHWGSGMPGKYWSIPYGDYPVTPNAPTGAWAHQAGAIPIANNVIPDQQLGRNRIGIMIHSGSSDSLDQLYTQGCFKVAPQEWPTVRAEILKEASNGPLYLHVAPGGVAAFTNTKTFSQASSDTPAANANAAANTTASASTASGTTITSRGPGAPPGTMTPGTPVNDFYHTAMMHESGGKNIPNATGGWGAAGGYYQFTPATYASVRAANPDLNLPENIKDANQDQQTAAYHALTSTNVQALQAANLPVNDKNVYMASFMGGGGASKFLTAMNQNPNASAADLFPKEAAANPTIFYAGGQPRSLNQVYALQTGNFGTGNTTGFGPASGEASGPIDPSIIARGGTSPAIPTTPVPGTTINSTPVAGIGGQMAQLGKDPNVKKMLGLPDDDAQGQQDIKPLQMPSPPGARNVSFLLGGPGGIGQGRVDPAYAQRMDALNPPMTWGSAPPGQMPGTGYGMQAQPSVYGTSLMSNLGRSLDPMWMNSWGT